MPIPRCIATTEHSSFDMKLIAGQCPDDISGEMCFASPGPKGAFDYMLFSPGHVVRLSLQPGTHGAAPDRFAWRSRRIDSPSVVLHDRRPDVFQAMGPGMISPFGLMNMANIVKGTYPEDVRKIVDYFTAQMNKLNVKLIKGKEVTPGIVESERPDVAILATGALLSDKILPGAHHKLVVSDLFLRGISNFALRFVSPATLSRLIEFWVPIGRSVLIMGGDIKGLQLAEFLLKRGRKVTIVTDEAPDKWGEGLPNLNNYKLNVWFAQQDIEIIRGVQYQEITQRGLIIATAEGEERVLKADSIMPVFPLRADEDLYQTLQGKVPEVFSIGACKNPKALIVDAIADASEVASSI